MMADDIGIKKLILANIQHLHIVKSIELSTQSLDLAQDNANLIENENRRIFAKVEILQKEADIFGFEKVKEKYIWFFNKGHILINKELDYSTLESIARFLIRSHDEGLIKRFIDQIECVPDSWWRVTAYLKIENVLVSNGYRQEAQRLIHQSYDAEKRLRDERKLCLIRIERSRAYINLDFKDLALQELLKALEYSEGIRVPLKRVQALYEIGQILIEIGDKDRILDVVSRIEDAEKMSWPEHKPYILIHEAKLLRLIRESEVSRDKLNQALLKIFSIKNDFGNMGYIGWGKEETIRNIVIELAINVT